jgi:Na+/melibiose symporter-like transporter
VPGDRKAGHGLGSIGVGYLRLARDPRFFLPAGIAMLATGMIAFYDAVSPFDFEVAFGLGKAQFGNLSLGLSVAYLVGALAVNRWVVRLGQSRLLRSGLVCVLIGGLLMLLPGLAGRFDAASLLLPMLVIVIGCGQLIPIGLAMPMQAFPAQAGQASALTGFLQQEGTGLLVSLATWIPDTSQLPLAAALLLIGLVLAILVRAYRRLCQEGGAP